MKRDHIFLAIAALYTLYCWQLKESMADFHVFDVASGDWAIAGNWDTGLVPGNGFTPPEVAILELGRTATISSAVPTVDEVWVGDGPTNGNLVVAAGGALNITNSAETGILVVGRTADMFGSNADSLMQVTAGSVVADTIEVGHSFGAGNVSTNAQLEVSGDSSVTVTNYMRVGTGDGTSGGAEGILTVKDNATFTHDGSGTRPFIDDFIGFGFNGNGGGNSGTLNLEDNAVFTSARPVRFGWVEEGKGFLNVSGNAQLIVNSGELSAAALMFGDFNNSAVGTGVNRPIGIATQSGGTVSVGTDAARPQWMAIGGSGRGEYHLSGGTLNIWVRDGLNIGDTDQNGFAGEGLFEMTGGTVNATEVSIAKIGRATGVFNQSDGTVNVGIVTPDGNFVDRIDTMGMQTALDDNYDGKLTLGGGFDVLDGTTVTVPGQTKGTYNLSGGTLHVRGMNVGFLAEGEFNQSGGTAIADVGVIVAFGVNSQGTPSTGTMNLEGGVFETAAIGGGGGGNSTVNFNGGVVRATVDQDQFIVNLTTANVAAGGLIVDSNGFDVTSNQSFSGAGGVTKQGDGALRLTGNSTYAGTTTVQGGALLVNASHSGTGTYTVDAGATLGGTGSIAGDVNVNGILNAGDGIGTFTVDGTVRFGAGGTLAVDIDTASGADMIDVVDLDLSEMNDVLDITLIGSVPAGDYLIANYSGTLTGTFNATGGFAVDYSKPNQIFVSVSAGGIPGDFDHDGDVDGVDYLIWQRGESPNPLSAEDLADWQANYGTSLEPNVAAVPEPAGLLWGLVASFAGLLTRVRVGKGRACAFLAHTSGYDS